MSTTPKSITYIQLGIIATAFAAGLLVGLFADSTTGATATSLSPMALIGFVISVLIGGASLVLAIVAIQLGRVSENAIVARGDESVRLQTEIYTKTTDALQKIASSTDVTEKRIEDIISGRVSDISHDLARDLPPARESRARLEDNIRRSILHSISSQETEAQRARERKEAEEQEAKYQASHKKALIAFGNKDGIKISKLEHGSVDEKGEDLFDGVYSLGRDKIAVSTFRPRTSDSQLRDFLLNSASEIKKGFVKKVVMILFSGDEEDSKRKSIEETIRLLPSDLAVCLYVIETSFAEVENVVESIDVANNAVHPSGESGGNADHSPLVAAG